MTKLGTGIGISVVGVALKSSMEVIVVGVGFGRVIPKDFCIGL